MRKRLKMSKSLKHSKEEITGFPGNSHLFTCCSYIIRITLPDTSEKDSNADENNENTGQIKSGHPCLSRASVPGKTASRQSTFGRICCLSSEGTFTGLRKQCNYISSVREKDAIFRPKTSLVETVRGIDEKRQVLMNRFGITEKANFTRKHRMYT